MRWSPSKILAATHAAAVVGASVWTFAVLHNNYTVSGLEYMLLIPLAFPWSVLPIRGIGIYADAVMLTLMGFANSVILYVILRRREQASKTDSNRRDKRSLN